MSIYNYLDVSVRCPRCGRTCTTMAEFRFGLRDLSEYKVGDTLVWEGKGVRTPTHRPPDGNYVGEAYAECPHCGQDFWLRVTVANDVIESYEVDTARAGYLE